MANTLGGVYQTGTVTVSADRLTVVGVGTLWAATLETGDWLLIGGQVGLISAVADDTHLTLQSQWQGTLPSASAYVGVKMSWLRYDPALTQAKLRQLLAELSEQGNFIFTDIAPPDPALGQDGQWALKTDVSPWRLWYKTGGVWVEQKAPAGMNWRGAWSAATSYAPGDGVSRSGSSYISKTANTNKPPEANPSDWDLMAAQGAQGNTGLTGPPGMTWRGTWSGATAYLTNDAVALNGASYIAIAPSSNQAPPNATYWNVLAGASSATIANDSVTPPMLDAGTAPKQQAFRDRIVAAPVASPAFTGSVSINSGAALPLLITSAAAYYPTIQGTVNSAGVGIALAPLDAAGVTKVSYLLADLNGINLLPVSGKPVTVAGALTVSGNLAAAGSDHALGSGGTGARSALVLNGGNAAANGGGIIAIQENSVVKTYLGSYKGILGGGSSDFLIWMAGAGAALNVAQNGVVSVLLNSPSSLPSNGALVVAGGVGVGGGLNAGGLLTTGGGARFEGNLIATGTGVGIEIVVGGGVGYLQSFNRTASTTAPLSINAAGTTVLGAIPSSNPSSGAFIVAGGVGVGGALNVGGNVLVGPNDTSAATAVLRVAGGSASNGGAFLALGQAAGHSWYLAERSALLGGTSKNFIFLNSAGGPPPIEIDAATNTITMNPSVTMAGDITLSKNNAKFHLDRAGSGAAGAYFDNSGTNEASIVDNGTNWVFSSNAAGTAGQYMVLGSNAWISISDARLPYKRTARDITDRLPPLDQFRLYENEVDGRLELFAKAQEVFGLFPHLVDAGDDDDDYVPSGMSDRRAWGMSYDRLGAVSLAYARQHASRLDRIERELGLH